jgi:aminopeptidase YwaD
MKNTYFFSGVLAALFLNSCGSLNNSSNEAKPVKINSEITANEVKDHISYLASDSLKGRKPGTPGGKLAAEYIASNFERIGLKSFEGSYFQSFDVVTNVKEGDNNTLEFNGNSAQIGVDYRPLAFTKNTLVEAPVIFAGYGIEYSDEKVSWEDYKNIDVKGKWVIVLRQDPDVDNADSPLIDFGHDRSKVLFANDKGAAGILLVNGVNTEKKDEIEDLYFDKSSSRANIPVIQISRAFANKLLEASSKTVEELEKQMIADFKTVNFELESNLKANTDIVYVETKTQNVLGYIEGSDESLKNEFIVVGAHYDHLGMGGPGSGSRAIDTIAVHNGADDNASGVAGMIEIAEKIAHGKTKPRRSVIFMGFAAEEMGLLGSKFFTENPSIDIKQVKMMLNFDMVGRLDEDNTLTIGGTGTTAITETIIDQLADGSGLNISKSKEGSGPSDHSAFYVKNVPVLFFFTGIHDDYHTPADDVEKINFAGEKMVLDLGYDLAIEFANMDVAPAFVQVDTPSNQSSRRKLKVTFGVVPNFGGGDFEGMKIDGARADGPAGQAGMQKGDIIVAINGMKVSNIYDYMARLGRLKKGERCNVDVMRDGKKIVFILDL